MLKVSKRNSLKAFISNLCVQVTARDGVVLATGCPITKNLVDSALTAMIVHGKQFPRRRYVMHAAQELCDVPVRVIVQRTFLEVVIESQFCTAQYTVRVHFITYGSFNVPFESLFGLCLTVSPLWSQKLDVVFVLFNAGDMDQCGGPQGLNGLPDGPTRHA